MLDTFIKNRGTTKTIIHNKNNHQQVNKVNELNWDADYDGKKANISLDFNNDGEKEHFDFHLSNKDLSNILNIDSIHQPLEKRLVNDFMRTKKERNQNRLQNRYNDMIIQIEDEPRMRTKETELYDLLSNDKLTHLSSPLENEELIIPLKIDDNSSSLTPKTHKTYKVYKIKNSSGRTSSTSRRRLPRRRLTRRKSTRRILTTSRRKSSRKSTQNICKK